MKKPSSIRAWLFHCPERTLPSPQSQVLKSEGHLPFYFAQRSQTIERVFAYVGERHGLRYPMLKGRARIKMEVLLTFTCMNLKKLAKWKVKDPGLGEIKSYGSSNSTHFVSARI